MLGSYPTVEANKKSFIVCNRLKKEAHYKMRKFPLKISLFILVLLLAACSNGETAGKEKNDNNDNNSTRSKDELVLSVSSEPESGFDPTIGWGHSASSIFQSILFKRGSDMEVKNDLATGYKLSADRLTWTVTIRNDVTFSDGSPLTADDVVYSYDIARTNPESNVDLTMVESIKRVDDYTIDFVLKTPQSTFIDKLMEIGIVPKKIHEADPKGYAQKPIGSGPYVLKQWDKGQQVVAERNEKYYGEKSAFKKLTLVYLEEDAIMTALKAGEIDMAKIPTSLSATKVDGMKVQEIMSVENQGIAFPIPEPHKVTKNGKEVPVGNAVTSDPAIRKAINIAVSREDMINGLLNGFGTPAYTGLEQMPWNNDALIIPDGDMEGAKNLLADAGWKDSNGDSVLEKNGVDAAFDIIYTTNSEQRQALAVYLSEALKELGLNITPVQKTWEEAELLMHSQPIVLSWGEHSPQLVNQLYHSKFQGIEYNNTGFYTNKIVDAHIEDALMAATSEEANELWKQAIYDGKTGFGYQGDATWAWFMNTNHLYMMRDDLNISIPKPQPHGGAILEHITEWKLINE